MSEDFHPEDFRPQNFGPNIFMGVIILILALALIILTFIPRGMQHIEGGPPTKGYNSSPNQQTSTISPSSLTASGLLVIPPLSLSA